MDKNLLEFVRSLGFGAMIGSGIVGLIYALFSDRFSAVISLGEVVLLGALLGAGLHKALAYVIDDLFNPAREFFTYYSRLLQLLTLVRLNIISTEYAKYTIRELTERYFLEATFDSPNPKGPKHSLPPHDES